MNTSLHQDSVDPYRPHHSFVLRHSKDTSKALAGNIQAENNPRQRSWRNYNSKIDDTDINNPERIAVVTHHPQSKNQIPAINVNDQSILKSDTPRSKSSTINVKNPIVTRSTDEKQSSLKSSQSTNNIIDNEDKILETQVRMFLQYLGKEDANEEGLAREMERMENNYEDMMMIERRSEDLEETEGSLENMDEEIHNNENQNTHEIVKRDLLTENIADTVSLINTLPLIDIASMIGQADETFRTSTPSTEEKTASPEEVVTNKDAEFRTIITFEEKIGTQNKNAEDMSEEQVTMKTERSLSATKDPLTVAGTKVSALQSRGLEEEIAATTVGNIQMVENVSLENGSNTSNEFSTEKELTTLPPESTRKEKKAENSTLEEGKKEEILKPEERLIDTTTGVQAPDILDSTKTSDYIQPATMEYIQPTGKEITTQRASSTEVSMIKSVSFSVSTRETSEDVVNVTNASTPKIEIVLKSSTESTVITNEGITQSSKIANQTNKNMEDAQRSETENFVSNETTIEKVNLENVSDDTTLPIASDAVQSNNVTNATEASMSINDTIINNTLDKQLNREAEQKTRTLETENIERSTTVKVTNTNDLSPLPMENYSVTNETRKVDIEEIETTTTVIESETNMEPRGKNDTGALDTLLAINNNVQNNDDTQTHEGKLNDSISDLSKTKPTSSVLTEDSTNETLKFTKENTSSIENISNNQPSQAEAKDSTKEVTFFVYSSITETDDLGPQSVTPNINSDNVTPSNIIENKNESKRLDETTQENNINRNDTRINTTNLDNDMVSEKVIPTQNITTEIPTETTEKTIENFTNSASKNSNINNEEHSKGFTFKPNSNNSSIKVAESNQFDMKDINKFKLRQRPKYERPANQKKILGSQKALLTDVKNATSKDESQTYKQMINSRRIIMDKMNSHVIEKEVQNALANDEHRFSARNKSRNKSNKEDQKESLKEKSLLRIGIGLKQKSKYGEYEDMEQEKIDQKEKGNNNDDDDEQESAENFEKNSTFNENDSTATEQSTNDPENTTVGLKNRLIQMRRDKIKNSYIKTIEKHRNNENIKNLKSNDLKSRINAMIDKQSLEDQLASSRLKFTNFQKLNESDEDGGMRQKIKYTPLRTPKPGFKIPVDKLFSEESPSNVGNRRRFTPTSSKNSKETNSEIENNRKSSSEYFKETNEPSPDVKPKRTFNRKSTSQNAQNLYNNLMSEKTPPVRPQFKPSTNTRRIKSTTTTEYPVEFETEDEIESETTSIPATTGSFETHNAFSNKQKPRNRNFQNKQVREEPARQINNINIALRNKPVISPVRNSPNRFSQVDQKVSSSFPVTISKPQTIIENSEDFTSKSSDKAAELSPEIDDMIINDNPSQTPNLKLQAQSMNKMTIESHEQKNTYPRLIPYGTVDRKFDVRKNLHPRLFKPPQRRNTESMLEV